MKVGIKIMLVGWLLASGVSIANTAVDSVQNATIYCPVTPDEPIDPEIYLDYEGERIFFCCNGCRKDFIADPEAYLPIVQPEQQAEQSANDSAHNQEHDHATDHADEPPKSVLKFMGRFHPLLVHFPIALLLTALFSEGLAMLRRKEIYSTIARFVLYLAAPASVIAASLGWLAARGARYPAEMAFTLTLHRWMGTSVALLSVFAALAAYRSAQRKGWVLPYRILLFLTAALVGATGHFGAMLIYGMNHFKW